MIIKTRGICLHTLKYSETSVIAKVLTEEKGLQSYIVSGVRTKKPKVSPSLLQPMTLLDMVVYFRENQQLFRTKELRPAHLYQRVPFELPRSSISLFVSEVLLRTLREGEPTDEIFEFAFKFMLFLDETDTPLANLPVYFLYKVTEYLGFMIEQPAFGEPYYFDQTKGYMLPEPPEHERYSAPDASALLIKLADRSMYDVHEVRASRSLRNQTINDLLEYLYQHLEGFKGVKSHRILSQLF